MSEQHKWPEACAAERKSWLSSADMMTDFARADTRRAVICVNHVLVPVIVPSCRPSIITVSQSFIQNVIPSQGFNLERSERDSCESRTTYNTVLDGLTFLFLLILNVWHHSWSPGSNYCVTRHVLLHYPYYRLYIWRLLQRHSLYFSIRSSVTSSLLMC